MSYLPRPHTASARGPLNGLEIVDLKHLPSTLSAIYRFTDDESFTPYIGAGLNYTLFFGEEVPGSAASTFATLGLENGKVELDNSLGVIVRAIIGSKNNDLLAIFFQKHSHYLIKPGIFLGYHQCRLISHR